MQGLGFRVWGLGFGVWGLGFGVWGLGFGVWGLGFGVWGWGLGFGVWRRVWGTCRILASRAFCGSLGSRMPLNQDFDKHLSETQMLRAV